MLPYILIALLLTFFIGFLLETIKMKLAFDRIQKVNEKIERKIIHQLKKTKDLNIFFINDLRKMIVTDFVKLNLIDDFELFKIDDSRLYMKFTKEKAEQELEIYLVKEHYDLREVSLTYDDRIDFN